MIDLGGGDAVEALKQLWYELREFETAKDMGLGFNAEGKIIDGKSFGGSTSSVTAHNSALTNDQAGIAIKPPSPQSLSVLPLAPVLTKPWFVVATKADLESTPNNFAHLQAYLEAVAQNRVDHPSGKKHSWRAPLAAFPVSAIRGEGVEQLPKWIGGLLNDL